MMGRDEIVAALVLLGWYLRRDSTDNMLGAFNDNEKTVHWLGFAPPLTSEMTALDYGLVRGNCTPAHWDEVTAVRLKELWAEVRGNDGT